MFLANSFQSANPFAALRSRVPTCNHPTSFTPPDGVPAHPDHLRGQRLTMAISVNHRSRCLLAHLFLKPIPIRATAALSSNTVSIRSPVLSIFPIFLSQPLLLTYPCPLPGLRIETYTFEYAKIITWPWNLNGMKRRHTRISRSTE